MIRLKNSDVEFKFKNSDEIERIVSKPDDRDGFVKVTMGGTDSYLMKKFKVPEFELATGIVLEGIEPEVSQDAYKSDFKELKSILDEKGFDTKMSLTGDNQFVSGHIKFTNNRNVKFTVSVMVNRFYDPKVSLRDRFLLKVSKAGGQSITKNIQSTPNALQYDLAELVGHVDKFTVNKTQILGAPVDPGSSRDFQDGVPCLKVGESLSEYFDGQSSDAGIVINSNGKFQPFVSYPLNGKEERCLHYDTKDYKTKNGAIKFLDKYGYDQDGKVNHVFDPDLLHEYLWKQSNGYVIGLCRYDGKIENTAEDGTFLVEKPKVFLDEEKGYRCTVDYSFTNKLDGRVLTGSFDITHSLQYQGSPQYFVYPIPNLIRDVKQQLESGELDYDPDLRTDKEKYNYHLECVRGLKKDISNLMNLDERHDTDMKYVVSRTENLISQVKEHQFRAKELKRSKGSSLDY